MAFQTWFQQLAVSQQQRVHVLLQQALGSALLTGNQQQLIRRKLEVTYAHATV